MSVPRKDGDTLSVADARAFGCDKCGRFVAVHNDAVNLAFELGHGDPSLVVARPRHLLPIEGVCEGSPSRAQYLEGQPRDSRGTWPYQPEWEEPVRAAYARLKAGSRMVTS